MEVSVTTQSPPQIGILKTLIFILFGLASLLGWNAIMSELPFFTFYLKKMDPATSFPFLNYALNIVLQFLMLYNRNLVPLRFRLIGGLISGTIIMILLPTIVLVMEQNSTANVIVTGAIILIMGMVNALCSGGFFALVSFFPNNLMIAFSAGQGFSGVMMNIIQYIVLGSVNSGDKKKDLDRTAWIYFGISSGCLLIILMILLYQLRTDFFKYYLKPLYDKIKKEKELKEKKKKEKENKENKKNNKNEEEKKNELENKNEENKKKEENNKNEEENKKEEIPSSERDQQLKLKENEEQKNNENNDDAKPNVNNTENNNIGPTPKKRRQISFFEMFKILMDLDILRTYINFISNTLFPKAGVTQALFKLDKYKTVTILIMYNFMDFFGRYIVLAFKQTKLKTYIISIGRTILIFLLIFNYYCQIGLKTNLNVTSILLIIYVIALGLTHGMGNSLCFGLAPTMVEDDLKLQAGSSMSFFTVFGLFLGSCLGFLTKYILEQIDKKNENGQNSNAPKLL